MKWEKDRQTDRQRLKSFGRGRENKIVGLLRLDCTFPFFFFLEWLYVFLNYTSELRLGKWVETLVLLDGITIS